MLLPCFVKVLVVSSGHVLPEHQQSNGRTSLHHSRNEEGDTPRNEMGAPDLFYQFVHQGHNQLRRSTTQVSPATGKSIGLSNLLKENIIIYIVCFYFLERRENCNYISFFQYFTSVNNRNKFSSSNFKLVGKRKH